MSVAGSKLSRDVLARQRTEVNKSSSYQSWYGPFHSIRFMSIFLNAQFKSDHVTGMEHVVNVFLIMSWHGSYHY